MHRPLAPNVLLELEGVSAAHAQERTSLAQWIGYFALGTLPRRRLREIRGVVLYRIQEMFRFESFHITV